MDWNDSVRMVDDSKPKTVSKSRLFSSKQEREELKDAGLLDASDLNVIDQLQDKLHAAKRETVFTFARKLAFK